MTRADPSFRPTAQDLLDQIFAPAADRRVYCGTCCRGVPSSDNSSNRTSWVGSDAEEDAGEATSSSPSIRSAPSYDSPQSTWQYMTGETLSGRTITTEATFSKESPLSVPFHLKLPAFDFQTAEETSVDIADDKVQEDQAKEIRPENIESVPESLPSSVHTRISMRKTQTSQAKTLPAMTSANDVSADSRSGRTLSQTSTLNPKIERGVCSTDPDGECNEKESSRLRWMESHDDTCQPIDRSMYLPDLGHSLRGSNPHKYDDGKSRNISFAHNLSKSEQDVMTLFNSDSFELEQVLLQWRDTLGGGKDLLLDAIKPLNKSVTSSTMLHKAAFFKDSRLAEEISTLYLDAGADVHALNYPDNTALQYAAAQGHTRLLQQLLAAGCDVRSTNLFSQTALHVAATNGQEAAVELLIKAMTMDEMNFQDCHRATAFFCACESGSLVNVQKLALAGVDIHLEDNRNRTGLEACKSAILGEVSYLF